MSGWNKFIWSVCKQGDKSIYGISWFFLCIWKMHQRLYQGWQKQQLWEKEMNRARTWNRTHIPQGPNSGIEARRGNKSQWNYILNWTVGKNPSNSKQISIMAQDTQVLQKCLKTTIRLFVPTSHISLKVSGFFFLSFLSSFIWTLHLTVLITDRPCDTPKLSWLKSRRPFYSTVLLPTQHECLQMTVISSTQNS